MKRNRNILLMAASFILLMALPVVSSAQGRGRGLARGHNKSWKCGKFVNCHDARNGRLDGRGPRRRLGLFNPNGVFVGETRRHRRDRIFDNEDRFRERRRIRNRHFDDDDRFRGRRMRNRDFDDDDLFRKGRIRADRDFRNDDPFRMRGRGRRDH